MYNGRALNSKKLEAEEEGTPILKLESVDGHSFEMDYTAARQIPLVRQQIEKWNGHIEKITFSMPGIYLKKIIEWCIEHKNDNPDSDDEIGPFSPWEEEFLKMEPPMLFEITREAELLNIKSLANACCCAIADKVENKSARQVRGLFQILKIHERN